MTDDPADATRSDDSANTTRSGGSANTTRRTVLAGLAGAVGAQETTTEGGETTTRGETMVGTGEATTTE